MSTLRPHDAHMARLTAARWLIDNGYEEVGESTGIADAAELVEHLRNVVTLPGQGVPGTVEFQPNEDETDAAYLTILTA